MVAGICNCHCGAGGGGKYRSMSNLGLLIDIRIATSLWPFLLCCKLGHVVHLSRCDVLECCWPLWACSMHHALPVNPVPFTSHPITTHTSTTAAIANKSTDHTSSPRYKITLPLLCYSLKPWAQHLTWLKSTQMVESIQVGCGVHALKLFNAICTPGTRYLFTPLILFSNQHTWVLPDEHRSERCMGCEGKQSVMDREWMTT